MNKKLQETINELAEILPYGNFWTIRNLSKFEKEEME